MSGKIFVIEGPDGSGKTIASYEVMSRLYRYYNLKATCLSLPCPNMPYYKEIRMLLKHNIKEDGLSDVLQQLMLVNMKYTFKDMIPRLLDNGINLILDRWLLSTIIYNNLDNGSLFDKNKDLITIAKDKGITPFPELIFYLNTPKDILLNHAKKRNENNTEIETNDKVENIVRCKEEYDKYIKALYLKNISYISDVFNDIDEEEFIKDETKFYNKAYDSMVETIKNKIGR